jgi:hypothetical protein
MTCLVVDMTKHRRHKIVDLVKKKLAKKSAHNKIND